MAPPHTLSLLIAALLTCPLLSCTPTFANFLGFGYPASLYTGGSCQSYTATLPLYYYSQPAGSQNIGCGDGATDTCWALRYVPTFTSSGSASLTASLHGTSSVAPTVSATPSVTLFPSGAACDSNATCANFACLGGFCCSPNAVRQGCRTCLANTGTCLLNSPGESCASAADCGTDECRSGCCCSASAARTVGCTACRCWSAEGTNASTAGVCTASAVANGTMPAAATLPCGGGTSVNTTIPLSRIISFPAGANVNDAVPLVYLPATSPLNDGGNDIVVATASTCAAYAAVASAAKCTAARTFVLPTGTYYYLGTAAALGMDATPGCPA
jgi:hypothetical protein